MMAMHSTSSILCPACGQKSLLKRAPRYDGFKRIGEILSCADCGHEFADATAVPFLKQKRSGAGLDPRELAPPPQIFQQDEAARLCRHCASYVVNPFVQRCAHWQKEVEATDTCGHFKAKPAPPATHSPPTT